MHFNYVFIIYLICSTYCNKVAEKAYSVTAQDDTTTRISALESKLSALAGQLSALTGNSRYTSDGVDLRDYMYRDSMIFQDVFNAYNSNIIVKRGSPRGWDETSYVSNPWNLRHILNIGSGANSNGNGIKINIPQGYDVIWLRVLNDRWATFRVAPFVDDSQVNFSNTVDAIERYAAGYRMLNTISPDGAGPDSQWNVHSWVPFPVRNGANAYAVHSDVNSDDWISGIAFSKNIWNHAYNPAVAYLWKLNGGDATGWVSENWNNDQLGLFNGGSNFEVYVPVIFTGRDKMLYIVEHNNNWTGTMHTGVYVNSVQVERFRTSWRNPFAVHHNSKNYCRYMGTRIPANIISQGDKFVRVRIDMTWNNNQHINFRELGTHDYN